MGDIRRQRDRSLISMSDRADGRGLAVRAQLGAADHKTGSEAP